MNLKKNEGEFHEVPLEKFKWHCPYDAPKFASNK
jgi:hypothetical protein